MTAKRRRTTSVPESRTPGRAELAVVTVVLFLSPLIAGKLTPIPSLAMQILVLLAGVAWLVRSAKRGILELPGRALVVCLAAFLILLSLSAVRSASIYSSMRELANFTSFVLIFFILGGRRQDYRGLYALMAILVTSALAVGVIAMREYGFNLVAGTPGWRTFATFFNPDFLAGFMALVLPIALAWYLSPTPAAPTVLSGLCVIFTFSSLITTGSRFGAAAAAGGIFVFLCLAVYARAFGRQQLIRAAVLIVPVVLIAIPLGKPLTTRVVSVKAESHSGGFRIHTWQGTARMAKAHPIVGSGLGTFEIAYPKYASVGYTKLAHNSYLQLAAEAGPISALSLCVFLGLAALPTAFALRRTETTDSPNSAPQTHAWAFDRGLAVSGLLGGTAASMARNVVDSDWYVTAIGISVWAALGAAVALGHPARTWDIKLSRGKTIAFSLLLAITLLGTLSMTASEAYLSRGDSVLISGDARGAEASYQSALTFAPWSAEAYRRMSRLHMLLADAYSDMTFAKKAETELRMALRFEPEYAKNHYQLARVYELLGKPDEAIRSLETGRKLDPNAVQLLLRLARAYEQSDRHEKALDVYRHIVQLEELPYGKIRAMPEIVQPEYIFAHAELGIDSERSGDIEQALVHYEKALSRIERYEESLVEIGPVLEAAGQRDPELEEELSDLETALQRRYRDLINTPQSRIQR